MTTPENPIAPAPPVPWKEAYARLHRDGRADFPPACLRYVENVVRQTASTPSPLPPSPAANPPGSGSSDDIVTHDAEDGSHDDGSATRSLTPATVIAAFREATQRDFGPLREDVLRHWGMRTPFDLGRAVTLLGRVDRLLLDEGDDPFRYAKDTVPFTEERSS